MCLSSTWTWSLSILSGVSELELDDSTCIVLINKNSVVILGQQQRTCLTNHNEMILIYAPSKLYFIHSGRSSLSSHGSLIDFGRHFCCVNEIFFST